MTALRRHVLSAVVVLLALATGVALGAGPLAGATDEPSATETPAETTRTAEPSADYAGARVAGTNQALLSGRLQDRRVVVVAAPGADEETVAAVTDLVGVAGGRVSASLAIGETLVAPGEKTLVDTLGEQLAEQNAESGVDPEASTFDRMGELLGRAVLTTRQRGAEADRVSESVLASLATADMLAGEVPEVGTRAPYVVVVLAGEEEGASDTAGPDAIWRALLGGLSTQARGTVVVAPAEDPALERLRTATNADEGWASITTVDADGTAAATTAVLALAQWPSARGHAFGVAGSDGARVMD